MSQLMTAQTLGADWSWLAPLTEGLSNVIGGVKPPPPPPPPPPPEFPWIPVAAVAAGALVLTAVAQRPKRKRAAA
jgi:hypothetical protein